jgi:hypothetical protein
MIGLPRKRVGALMMLWRRFWLACEAACEAPSIWIGECRDRRNPKGGGGLIAELADRGVSGAR